MSSRSKPNRRKNARPAAARKPPPPTSDSGRKPSNSKNLPGAMLDTALGLLEDQPALPSLEEPVEDWLDWGIALLKDLGPLALEVAPMLLALL